MVTALAVIVVAAIGLLLYFHNWQQIVPITMATTSYQDITDTVSNIGTVELTDKFEPHATSPGMVQKLYVQINQKVRAGQLLLRMEDSEALSQLANNTANLRAQQAAAHDLQQGGSQDELNGFQIDLRRDEAQHQQALERLAQAQALEKTGADSHAEVLQAQQQVTNTQLAIDSLKTKMSNRYSVADIAKSRAQIEGAQASIAAANSLVKSADIRSPIDGTVFHLDVSQYDYVPAGDSLISVADLTRMRVRGYFDEPDIGKLATGQPVKIVWEAKPGREWHGHVVQPPTTVTAYNTRHVGECLISVDDPDGVLPPAANVTVTVTTRQHKHVLVIPHEALRTDGSLNYVYVVQGDHLVRTPVQLSGGIVTLTQVEVTGGLTEGQKVALGATSSRELTDGLRVVPVDGTHE